jgi:lipid A 4'-phosphatase
MNRYNRVFLAGSLLVALLFVYVPEIDLWAAGLFYDQYHGFILARHQLAFVPTITKIFVVASCVLLTVNAVRMNSLGAATPIVASPRTIIFLLFSLGLGPGLFVNTILKDHWGRARPVQIKQFGGDRRFTAAFALSDQCGKNCSFVSGDAAIGYYGLAFLFIARRRRVIIALTALLSGTAIGLIRMAQGTHFLSDVIFSGVFTFLVAWLLYFLILDRQNTSKLLLGSFGTRLSKSSISSFFRLHSDPTLSGNLCGRFVRARESLDGARRRGF